MYSQNTHKYSGIGNVLAPDEQTSRIPVKIAACVPRGTEVGQLNVQRSLLAEVGIEFELHEVAFQR
jgi:hypothetical protein